MTKATYHGDELTPDILRELKQRRLSDEAIANMYHGVTSHAVRRMRKANDIPTTFDVVNSIVDLDVLRRLKKQGKTDKDCARRFGVSLTVIRKVRKQNKIPAPKSTQRNRRTREEEQERRLALLPQVHELHAAGLTSRAIGQKLMIPESTVRSWINPNVTMNLATVRKSSNAEDNLRIVYDWIVAYKYMNNGNSPTQNEVAEGAGFARGFTHHLLALLQERGQIRLPNDTRAGGIVVVGGQWIPPTGWKMPARLRKHEKIARPRIADRKRLAKDGRLCDCGQMATHYAEICVGTPSGNGGRPDTMPLCNQCASYAVEIGEIVKPYSDSRKAA